MAPNVIAHIPPAGFVRPIPGGLASREAHHFPLFRNPDKYLQIRERAGLRGWLRRRRETRAIDRCLADLPIRSVCDVPAGPGRLFHHWEHRGWRVDAFDLSESMVSHAAELHRTLGLEGQVRRGNAFALREELATQPDLVASIRFAYYFDREERIALWRSLGEASARYVLVHFKVASPLAGALNGLRRAVGRKERTRRHSRRILTPEQIAGEVEEAGLRLVRFVRSSPLSLASYALAERVPGDRPGR